MSSIKPIKVWGQVGPNPPKVSMILGELGVPHEVENVGFADLKKPEYLAVNPNGRMPAIHDPNTNITLWESGAILEYITDKYDTEHKFSFAPGTPEYYHAKQWLFFQVSGQGPYYGQGVWFHKYHPEQIDSAKDRYKKEIVRVTGVLEEHLKKQKQGSSGDGPWLVGNKYSYADLCFIPWQAFINMAIEGGVWKEEEYPHVKQWLGNMMSRQAIQKAMAAAKP